MQQIGTPTSGVAVAHLSGLCLAAALALAVFYHGPQIPLLAGAQFLLVTWLALSVGSSYAQGIRLPLTPLSISLTLFWLWLGISLFWSAVPVTSITNFWWVGSLALVFWCYTLAPQRDRIWFAVSRFLLVGALFLCGYALVQVFAWHQPPRSTFVNIHSFAALMMLIALPLSASFLETLRQRSGTKAVYVLGVGLFVLFFTIASTEGRGTTLSLTLGVAVLAVLSWRSVGARSLAILGALFLGAYLGAYLALHDDLSGARLATLADPGAAGATRFLIWRGAWDMLLTHPWWGIGLGTYYLAWPPYRDPTDNSLGFFVHNDYLQIWIEAGLPALLLLLAVLGSTLYMLVQLLRRRRLAPDVKLEATGLFCGLLAVAAHSFLDFNLYILPISIVAGLVLGRFHDCVNNVVRPRERWLRPASAVQWPAYRLIVVLLALFPLTYFIALGSSDHLYKAGFRLAAEGKLEEADNAFAWAERLVPGDDKVLMMHADLYRHVLGRLPRTEVVERRALYEAAREMLDKADSANPYRPLIHSVRGRLLEENPDLAGRDWRASAEASYERALALDPRFFSTRMAYARLLLDSGRPTDAYAVLEAGMQHWYYPGQAVLAYYAFTAQLARQQRQEARAGEIERQIGELRQAIAKMAPARRIVTDLTPATASAI